jgi:dihydroorotate dehydrogenase
MYKSLRSLLFRLDAETAHHLTLNLIRISGVIPGLREIIRSIYKSPCVPVEVFGLRFRNPIGLAAGYDKDGIGWRGLALLGFGHIELGTVTPLPQPGNPHPRIFRLVNHYGLVNRMGFPGRGAEFLAGQLQNNIQRDLILGVNIGKNAATPMDSAADDYLSLIRRFASLADYLVINISSPNTAGLLRLQARHALDKLLTLLMIARQEEEKLLNKRVPLLVKLSPDLSKLELKDALDVMIHHRVDGVVATNTSTNRGIVNNKPVEVGGISGKPLQELSTDVVRKIHALTSGDLPIIGVGGISNTSDARSKLDAGAALIQIYTGLIYQGPGLVKNILKDLNN